MAARPPSAHNGGLQTEETASIHELHGWRRLVAWLLAQSLRLWGRTLRLEADAATHQRLAMADEPAAFVIWHNRLFISSEYVRRYRTRRRLYVLVSASKDGAWSAAFQRMIGLVPVRGSSNNHGREAGKTLIEVLRAGHDIGLTPDGPRGPLYEVKPGVLIMTRRTHSPMVLLGVEFTRAWRLKSWDRFCIPLPFSRVIMRCTILPSKNPDGTKPSAAEVGAAMRAINPD